jgi:hypothetical protein
MSSWQYIAADLRTNQPLAELPLTGVSFEEILNGAGVFSATLPLAGDAADSATTRRARARFLTAASTPGRTAVYALRDGSVVGGAIIWTRTRESDAPAQIAGAGFWSFFRLQHLRVARSYVGVDQLAIARDLVQTAEAVFGADIGVTVGTETSPVVRSQSWAGYELKQVAGAVEELAALDRGFDVAIDITPTLGKVLTLSYPRRGRLAGTTGLVFARGKNLLSYRVFEDDTQAARTFTAVGAGDGDDMLLSTATRTDLLDAGYPLTSATGAWKDEAVAANLAARSVAEVAARALTPTTWSLSIDPDDIDGGLGRFIAGDDVLLEIDDDDNFPRQDDGAPGYSAYHRILSWKITVPDQGPDELSVQLGNLT